MSSSSQHREASTEARSRWAIPVRYFFVFFVIVALIVPAASYVALAQQADKPWREVRTLYTEDYGLSNPQGLAFSPDANAFLVWNADGSVEGITMYEDAVDLQGVTVPAGDVRNIAFNGYSNALFALGGDSTQLDAISVDAQGLPARSGSAERYDLGAADLQGARGITFDPATGRMFVLNANGDELVITADPASGLDLQAKVSRISLKALEAGSLQGIAFNPNDGNLYLSDPVNKRLYTLTQSGQKVSQYDLSSLELDSPTTLVFAPSVDRTDDPSNMNLFVLDSGQSSAESGRLVELSLEAQPDLPGGVPILPATLVRVQNINNTVWNPSSPDSSGIDYWPQQSRLVITDSEVEEMPPYWAGANVFTATTSGTLLSTCSTMAYNNEPTGIGINPNTNRIYITSDAGGGRYYEINIGPDNTYCTSDDVVLQYTLSTDLEDVAYGNNKLFFAGGIDAEVFYFDLGPNQIVGGGDDGPMQNFDTNAWGFTDMEGIGFHSDAGTILIHGSMGGGVGYVAEVSQTGTLLRAYDVSFMGDDSRLHSDITYAPSSFNPNFKTLYIVSRGVDNGQNPNENDGKWWEINIGDPVPTSTPTFGPSPTATRTPTPSRTPSPSPTGTIPPGASTNPMYVSFSSNGTVAGVAFGDEDVLRFNGSSWDLYFDGSDVGLTSADVFGFTLLNANTALLAFDIDVTLGGITYSANDIVRFNATSFGANTAGTFSMYLDGSDVGLDTSAERLDAIHVLGDGRVLISTTGNPTLPNLTGNDEDIWALTPTSLGDNTAGTWAMYFDGSDVGLADTSNEDIDALDIAGGNIYLSTVSDFSVTGIAGLSNDIFICAPTSLGEVTACAYQPTLYFDASTWGLGTNNIDAFGYLSFGPIPTATTTRTPTATSTITATGTVTRTPTATHTATATGLTPNTPTSTATATATATQPGPSANLNVFIGGTEMAGSPFTVLQGGSARKSYPNIDSGPVRLVGNQNIIGAERVIYNVNGVDTSFSEMMGLPAGQLSNTYWLPWYNNKDLDTQLRIANVSNATANVEVFIGGISRETFSLAAGASIRRSYANVDSGPVRIVSSQNIIAAERVIYRVQGVDTSFSEMMALPNSQVDTVYWLPWYNNKDLNTQLRIANVSNATANVEVFIGGISRETFSLAPGASIRRSYPNVDSGPVRIVSSQNIIAAERVIYKVNNVDTSFSEMMGLPAGQLSNTYWLPWYNNKDLDTQLRIANVSNQSANVQVFINNVVVDSFSLAPGASIRRSYANVDSGPVRIVSNRTLVAAERVIYNVNNLDTSFSEMMGLPASQLSNTYWMPWYNSKDLNTQLRIGIP